MRLAFIIITSLFIASAAWAVSYPQHVPPAVFEEFIPIDDIKLCDIHGTSPAPSIPKTWKLISVSTGEKSNASNLWFQDTDGSIYLLQGFTAQNKFVIHKNVYKLPTKLAF
ncbi:MAG: hypothetical protein LWW87_01125 [Geobacteraceae bacterium]|nr:hypothetical protein [Geobacteraceae bacterium]